MAFPFDLRYESVTYNNYNYVRVAYITSMSRISLLLHETKAEAQVRVLITGLPRGEATGAICPGPHSASSPILTNVTSIM